MKREEIREMTMQVVYQMDVMGDFDYRNISLITENEQIQKEKQALQTLDVIRDHRDEIDEMIDSHSDRWKTTEWERRIWQFPYCRCRNLLYGCHSGQRFH